LAFYPTLQILWFILRRGGGGAELGEGRITKTKRIGVKTDSIWNPTKENPITLFL
jgi:hypothetical protein